MNHFPRNHRQPAIAQPQPRVTNDPAYQVLCKKCQFNLCDMAYTIFRQSGQTIGSQDVTVAQIFICRRCGEAVDAVHDKRRKDYEDVQQQPTEPTADPM